MILSFSDWLISLSIVVARFIHAVTKNKISLVLIFAFVLRCAE